VKLFTLVQIKTRVSTIGKFNDARFTYCDWCLNLMSYLKNIELKRSILSKLAGTRNRKNTGLNRYDCISIIRLNKDVTEGVIKANTRLMQRFSLKGNNKKG